MKKGICLWTLCLLSWFVPSMLWGSTQDSTFKLITYPYAEIPIDLGTTDKGSVIRDLGQSIPRDLQTAIINMPHGKISFLDRSSAMALSESVNYENLAVLIDQALKIVSGKVDAFMFARIEKPRTRSGWIIIRAKIVDLQTKVLAEDRVDITIGHLPDSLDAKIQFLGRRIVKQLLAETTQPFAITWPTNGEVVSTSPIGTITIRGVGAVPKSKIEVSVKTDAWNPQTYNAQVNINSDGTWTFEPCYLKGQGDYKKHHTIQAKMTTPDGQTFMALVENVATKP